DVRVIAATNADLEGLVKQKRFREDLFYRLDVVTLTLPPLRERQEDIPLLAEYFLKRHYLPGKEPQFSLEVIQALQNYEWPGNIRELANTIARVAVVCNTPTVLREHLPPKICNRGTKLPEYREEGSEKVQACAPGELFPELQEKVRLYLQKIDLSGGFDLPRFLLNLKQLEIDAAHFLIDRALKESLGKYPVAAQLLKTTPRTLRYLRKEKVDKDT
ncbi:MAG: sigma 54-interacting transcriptional regulator, partial [Moorella sp. (in: firmicutes)]